MDYFAYYKSASALISDVEKRTRTFDVYLTHKECKVQALELDVKALNHSTQVS
jgi:hypothetical protein